jgi:hypothetical protein
MLMQANSKVDISAEQGHTEEYVTEYVMEILNKAEQEDAAAPIGGEPAILAPL